MHFCTINASVTTNIRPTASPIPVVLPDGSTIHSTHDCDLIAPFLPLAARKAHIFPTLTTTLISISMMCDAGCIATFTSSHVTVTLHGQAVLQGPRDPTTGLWTLTMPTAPHSALTCSHPPSLPSPARALAAQFSATPAELVAFAHAALFSPVLSTLCLALDNNYIHGFPGLTSALVRKYPPQSAAMIKGHLDQSRKNQRSTKPASAATTVPPHLPTDEAADFSPFPPSLANLGNWPISAMLPVSNTLARSSLIKQVASSLHLAQAPLSCSYSTTTTATTFMSNPCEQLSGAPRS